MPKSTGVRMKQEIAMKRMTTMARQTVKRKVKWDNDMFCPSNKPKASSSSR